MIEPVGRRQATENIRRRARALCVMVAATVSQTCLGSHGAIAASSSTCMEADKASGWTSGGLLTQRMFKDAAGRSEAAYILVMPQAECLKGRDDDNVGPTRTVQLYSSDSAIEKTIRRFVGKRIMVEGRAFGATTAHHHAPIVVDISSIGEP